MLPYAEGHGCKTFGAIGTCWGSYMVVRLAADPKMKAGVSMHPSHSPIMATHLGEDEEEILNEIQVHLQGVPGGLTAGLGRLGFVMFHHLALVVCSQYSSHLAGSTQPYYMYQTTRHILYIK